MWKRAQSVGFVESIFKGQHLVNITLAVVVLLLASAPYTVAKRQDTQQQRSELVPSLPASSSSLSTRVTQQEPLLVSTLDGKVTAVDAQSGATIWTFDTESPLVSAVASKSYPFSVVPGVQGELYTQERGLGGKFQVLPQTVPQWVDKTPSVMGDGSLWLGSRHTHAFFVDGKTGKLIKSYVEYGDGTIKKSSTVTDVLMGGQPILIGRVDYTVRAVNQETGEELFNVSYSHLLRLNSESQLPKEPETPTLHGPQGADGLGISLDTHQKNALQRLDPKTGKQLWSTAFEEPPIAIFSKDDVGTFLREQPALLTDDGLASKMLGRKEQPGIVVDRIGGSYYALPLAQARKSSHPFQALLPAAGAEEAPECTLQEQATGQDDAADDKETAKDLSLGVHRLEKTPSPIAARIHMPANSTDETWTFKRAVEDIGLISASLVTGGAIIVFWVFSKITESPRVIASLKDREEDIKTLTLSYTGTIQEAEDARRNSRAVLDNAASSNSSTIRDWTGSGVEHIPEEQAQESQGTEIEESPFSAPETQTGRRPSSSNSSFESPRTGMKKRKKSKKQKEPSKSNEGGVEAPDGLASTGDASSGESEEEGSRKADADDDESQPSTSGREFGSGRGSRGQTSFRRSEWRDGVTYIGRLAIGPGIVGYGSGGTLVFEGSLDGRQVAVKRVLRQFYDLARKEIGALIVADEHPNIVRCFAMEEDAEFVYLALERCKQSLNDLLGGDNLEGKALFVNAEGQCTDLCMRVCEEAGKGLLALHEQGIVHRDLKPHNVLLTEGNRTKLSDMGLCKRLNTDQTSYDSAGPGGSTGWQAPEQLILRSGGEARQGKSVDIFAFGLLLFYCLSGGQHAFGEGYERDYRILNGQADLGAIARFPEAVNLIRAMLKPQPKQRPSMAAVMSHPFWWSASRKLAFFIDVSNRVENEDREVDRSLLQALESCSEEAIGGQNWAQKLDPDFLANLGRYRKYNPSSLRDLLRVIRNKHNHFREMPEELQERLGPLPDAFLRYFAMRFPGLLLTTYSFALSRCCNEPLLESYFPAGAKDFPLASTAASIRFAQSQALPTPPLIKDEEGRTNSAPASGMNREPPLATVDELRETTQRAKSDPLLPLPPPPSYGSRIPSQSQSSGQRHRGWWSSSDSERSSLDAGSENSTGSSASQKNQRHWQFLDPSAYATSSGQRNSSPTGQRVASPSRRPPLPPHASEAPLVPASLVAAGRAEALPGQRRKHSEPDKEGVLTVEDALKVPACPAGAKQIRDDEGFVNIFPQRPDASVCDFFLKTGHCKFGDTCKFHHPLSAAVKLTLNGEFPLRPGQAICPFYDRTGECKYAASCKFHHPHVPACHSSDSNSQRSSEGSQRPSSRT